VGHNFFIDEEDELDRFPDISEEAFSTDEKEDEEDSPEKHSNKGVSRRDSNNPEAELWAEVLKRAVEDFKTYMAYRKNPELNPLSAKMVRSIVADGCDPEYWIFARNTGFDAVCMVLSIEPDCVRRTLRTWLAETLDMEPSY
jgi:hypothetical protein